MGRASSDIIDYCNECLSLFPKSIVAQNTIIIIILETLLPQICKINFLKMLFVFQVLLYMWCLTLDDSLAPVAKLTDALNRIDADENNQVSSPTVCGKAYFSIRSRNYASALESLINLDQEDGNN